MKLNKEKLICAALVIIGIVLCVGGVFFPMLLVPGAALLSGGLGLLVSIVHENDRININNPVINHNYMPNPGMQRTYDTKPKDKEKPDTLFKFHAKKAEEPESISVKLDDDLQEKINRLNDVISHLDYGIIDTMARQFEDKSHRHDKENDS